MAGWACVSDALEGLTSLTCLNGCRQYGAIRAGGLAEIQLGGTELGVWAARFLGRSESTLISLDVRCAQMGLRVGCAGSAPPCRPEGAPLHPAPACRMYNIHIAPTQHACVGAGAPYNIYIYCSDTARLCGGWGSVCNIYSSDAARLRGGWGSV